KTTRPAVRELPPPRIVKPRDPTARMMPEAKADDKPPGPGAPSARPARPTPALKVPPLLLEGAQPAAPTRTGPGQRYALGPAPAPEHVGAEEESRELPEAYGTKKLLLAARDPHWLYAHWDLTREQLRECNRSSADGHLVLRV